MPLIRFPVPAPSVQGTATNTFSATTAVSGALPTGYVPGDLLIIWVFAQDNGRISNTPVGWTALTDITNATAGEGRAFWKKAAGSEGTSVAITLAGSSTGGTIAMWIRNWDGVTAPGEAAAGNTNTPASLTVTWARNDQPALWLSFVSTRATSLPTLSFGAGWTGVTLNNTAQGGVQWRIGALRGPTQTPPAIVQTGGSGIGSGCDTLAIRGK